MSAKHIHFFFTLREQIKLYHWQTHSYARHKATDDVLEKLDKKIDEFVEVYMGKYGRPKMTTATATSHVQNLTEKGAVSFIRRAIQSLLGDLVKGLKPEKDSDLLSIRDEILAHLNQLLYLFTLH
jgi:DNA-binding ferritin-like protein